MERWQKIKFTVIEKYESRCIPCSVEVPVEKGSPMLEAWLLSCFSCVQHFGTLWTVAHQAPLSMGFSRQEYWSGLPRPPLGDLPDPGIDPSSLMSSASAGGLLTTSTAWETLLCGSDLSVTSSRARERWTESILSNSVQNFFYIQVILIRFKHMYILYSHRFIFYCC